MVFSLSAQEIVERQGEYAEARNEYGQLRFSATAPIEDELSMSNEQLSIDFDALRAINPDIVGWIVVPGTEISYPIVQGRDNAHYLRHTFGGRQSASGAIFLDYRDAPDFRGRARIYGHNMRDGSMFAGLRGWDGDRFLIHTPDGTLEFAVTMRRAVSVCDGMFTSHADGVTLVTCVNGRPDVRFVVRGWPDA